MFVPQFRRALLTSTFSAASLLVALSGPGCMKDKGSDASMQNQPMDGKSSAMKPAGDKTAMPMMEKPLYDRLGGEPALTAVVEDFVGRAATNEKVNFFRKGTAMEWKPSNAEVAAFKKSLVAFIAGATGGPKNYKGKDMKTAHAGMQITHEEFMALAADLSASLDKFKVPAKEKDELMAIAASTHDAIVEKK